MPCQIRVTDHVLLGEHAEMTRSTRHPGAPRGRHRAAALAGATLTLVVPLLGGGASPAAADEPELPAPAFSAVPLPTWQVGGIVWALAATGDVVVAGGRFSTLREPGPVFSGERSGPLRGFRTRVNLAVLDAATGEPTDCRLDVTQGGNPGGAIVKALTVSPDGSVLYVGGRFTRVQGQARTNVAAVDLAACRVLPWAPAAQPTVNALAASTDTVYVGGSGRSQRLVAFGAPGAAGEGTTRPFRTHVTAPVREQGTLHPQVHALALSPDGADLVVGGSFDTVNGRASRAVGVVDARTGETRHTFPGVVPGYVRGVPPVNRGSVVKSIAVDATGFYTAHEGTGKGVYDGKMAFDWDGTVRWKDGCLGATQAVVVHGDLLYGASHHHDCARMGAFPERTRIHLHAQTLRAGQAPGGAPTAFTAWWPDTDDGRGESLGPRALVVAQDAVGEADHLWVGGEFTRVTDAQGARRSQAGLVRYGQRATGGPTAPLLLAATARDGGVRLLVRPSWDRDDPVLTYRAYRDDTLVATVRASHPFWAPRTLALTDDTVDAVGGGRSYRYRVTVSDGTTTRVTGTRTVYVP